MTKLSKLIDMFWKWAGCAESWQGCDITQLPLDPLCFPQFEELRSSCISLINCALSYEELCAFLFCMALDTEEEDILDACKELATNDFLQLLLSEGVFFPQSETRWQMTELIRKEIPDREYYLKILLNDSNAYVRKRAGNIAAQFEKTE